MANKLAFIPLLVAIFFISAAECKWDIIVIVLHSVTFFWLRTYPADY